MVPHRVAYPALRMADVAFAGQFHPQIVIATATDANPNAAIGFRRRLGQRRLSGANWTHVALPGSCSPGPTNAFGIAYVAVDTIYVATDCGLVVNGSVGATN